MNQTENVEKSKPNSMVRVNFRRNVQIRLVPVGLVGLVWLGLGLVLGLI